MTDYDPSRVGSHGGPDRKAGKPFRKPRGKKAVRVKLDGKTYLAANCAWLWMTGEWPARRVIHKDGNIKNDCWANLELENEAGVYYDEAQDKWCAKTAVIAVGSIPRKRRTLLSTRHLPSAACVEELSKLGLI